jgi:hypothetical protein
MNSEMPRPEDPRRLSRRDFVRGVGSSALYLAAGSAVFGAGGFLASCGDSRGGLIDPPADAGEIQGNVVDLEGRPQAIGRIYVYQGNGMRLEGTYADVQPDARFRLPNMSPGDYQLRFEAPRLARVPPSLPHPIRLKVEAGRNTTVTVRVELGIFNPNMIEIYCGDNFFQPQPLGAVNEEVTVRKGTLICWYNVGLHNHIVVGGNVFRSHDLSPTAAYIWPASVTGFFPYECSYHLPEMRATLRVVD